MAANVNVTGKAAKKRSYDAIVVGSGICGGWAAKELCEKGIKTLVLERGKSMDYDLKSVTGSLNPLEFENHSARTANAKAASSIQRRCYAWNEGTQDLFVNDEEHPYEQVKPFDWIRGYQVGGKSLMWAKQSYRMSPMDFEANAKDGIGTDWPIRYEDLDKWYSYVENFAGISGNSDGLEQLPDGDFIPAMKMNRVEEELVRRLHNRFPKRRAIMGRTAIYNRAAQGRGPCLYRDPCHPDCPFSEFFNSNSATLPAAMATDCLTLKTNSIVHSIIYSETKNDAKGVRVIDVNTGAMSEYYAKMIFVNASTMNSALILLNSTSTRFPNGLGNDSDLLGRNLMVHNYRVRFHGNIDGFEDVKFTSGRPTSPYIPRFRNFGTDQSDKFLRGYALSIDTSRQSWDHKLSQPVFGGEIRPEITRPGSWTAYMHAMGETLPDLSNRVTLNGETDNWGMPVLSVDCEWKENDEAMTTDMLERGKEILDAMGVKDIQAYDNHQAPGLDIHEMGTACMGNDPKTSVLNKWNQIHSCKNVFVTDGSSMNSSACQNPTLTYMALTARACNYAVKSLNSRDL